MAMRIILLLLVLLTGCGKDEAPKATLTSFSGVEMTIPYRILIGSNLNEIKKARVQTIIDRTFAEVDNTFNKYNPDSELSKLNHLDAFVSTPISVELSEILRDSTEIVAMSEGRFDPTVEPAVKLWRDHLQVGCKPPEADIEMVSAAVGWHHVHYSDGQFWKENSKTQLDLGGIAKGLCVDMLTDRLQAAGFPNVFVEWGGEIRAAGKHPEGRPWTVFISRLEDIDPEHAIDFVALENQAIATSGDYLQRWTVGGITYSHIVDPETCRAIEVRPSAIASATVLAPTCTVADALATAAMLFPDAESARKWAEEVKVRNPDVSFWIISREEVNR